jgi:alpha amylase-like protein
VAIAKINNCSTTGLDIACHISDPGDHCGPIRYAGSEEKDLASLWIMNCQLLTLDISAYHGYWQQDMYRVNPFFGTVEDLLNLSNELHSRNMVSIEDASRFNCSSNSALKTPSYTFLSFLKLPVKLQIHTSNN